MHRRPLHLLFVLFLPFSISSQTVDVQLYRTYDGAHNNLSHPDWGAAGTNLLRVSGIGYTDGMATPGGIERPNPREVSNTLFAQDGLLNDPLTLSDFCWAWGQFLDHDIGLTPDGGEPAFIQVPTGDPWFDPNAGGQAIIPMMRNMFDPATGTSVENPRQHPNMITAFIDGSAVYGSSDEHAAWLRAFTGGKLKVSAGNLLPFNTTTGEFDAPVDPDAPHMDDALGTNEKLFVGGDARANENPLLTSFHTLFVREHNRLCDQLAEEHPEWSDEALYQHARKLVGGLIQSIVFDEWLPVMGVDLPEYTGYQEDINGQLYNVFTAAAFRLGHTLLNTIIQRLDNDGNELPEGNLTLRQSFFNPGAVLETGGIDPFFKGMAVQVQQSLDARVINDIRNFLFGPPGAGGLDLASININRGRERGLPDFNTVREAFGLPRYSAFQQFNSNAAVFTQLFHLYLDVNDVDPWVGMLAEEPMPGALFGETIMAIMHRQFIALRDGDRFFYLNDPVLSPEEKNWISRTTLRDIIMYNTTISLMQDNVFKAMPHSEICDNMTGSLEGIVRTENGDPIPSVVLKLELAGDNLSGQTSFTGAFSFASLPSCKVSSLYLDKPDDIREGLSTLDVILIQKHILGLELLDSPYKMVAADGDRNGKISVLDIIAFRRVILGLSDEFPNNTVWRFVPADLRFDHPENALTEALPEYLSFENGLAGGSHRNFIGVKIGDIDGNAKLEAQHQDVALDTRTTDQPMELVITDMDVKAGEIYHIPLRVNHSEEILGLQFGLQFDPAAGELLSPEQYYLPGLGDEHIGRLSVDAQLTFSWNQITPLRLSAGQEIMELSIRVSEDGRLSDFLWLDDRITTGESYTPDYRTAGVALVFEAESPAVEQLEVAQNYPNPFDRFTRIPFSLQQDATVELRIFDAAGKVLYEAAADYLAGRHEWQLNNQSWPTGVLYYQLSDSRTSVTRRMIAH